MKLAAAIVETRPSPGLKRALNSADKFLPSKWDRFAFGSKQTKHFFSGYNFRQVIINSLRQYNTLMTSADFWRIFKDYERVLIFQSDSELLRSIDDEFLRWDYVGAPWDFQEHGANGGLSIRNPSVMLEIIERYPWRGSGLDGYEDVYFCNMMHKHKIGKLAPRDVCSLFSVEKIYKLGTVGYHAIDKYLTKQQCHEIKNQYK